MRHVVVALALVAAARPAAASDLRVVVAAENDASRGGLPALEWEILSGWSRLAKVNLVRVPGPPSAVGERKADVVAGTAGTIADAGLAWSEDVVPTRFVVVSRRPSPTVAYVEELRGKKVAAAGPLASQVAGDAKIHAQAVKDGATAMAVLGRGEVDAAIVDMYEALQLHRADAALQLGAFVGPRQVVRFALRTGDPSLAPLNAYLRQLRASSSWGMLLARHLGPAGMETLGRARLSVR
jgi:ABC-type amino acid transport substrate-binding protein